MKNKKFLLAVQIAAAAAATLVFVGCDTMDKSGASEFFPGDEGRCTQNFMAAQSAAGARADGTLQSMHFKGSKLNSLGEAKLDLMLKDEDAPESIVIYMNLDGDDADLHARRDAVSSYLEDRGIDKDQVEFKAGTNPHMTSLAADHLARMDRTESGGSDAKADGGASAAGTSSGSSASK